MLGLAAALVLGGIIALPQLIVSLRYFPRSIRSGKTAAQKQELGNIPLTRLTSNLVYPAVHPIDGVFGPEAMTFIGLPALVCTLLAYSPFWWVVVGVSTLLAMGTYTPLFRLTHRLHLRIPARYCYFVSLGLAFLAIEGFATLTPSWQRIVLFLQAAHLVLVLPRLWPMLPYVQRWSRPSDVMDTPLTRFLGTHLGGWRVSGLPYPLRTGQVHGFRTLGYNGGSQAQWMATFRGDTNPNGSGGHDWFALNEDGDKLDWYGVKYAYTYRPLTGKWTPTAIPHLYENTKARPAPAWDDLAD